jgi:hypothetical protein
MDSTTDLHKSEMWFKDLRWSEFPMWSFILKEIQEPKTKGEWLWGPEVEMVTATTIMQTDRICGFYL